MTENQQEGGIPPQIQQQLAMFQQLQQQLQQVSSQKVQYEVNLREVRHALDELEEAPDDVVVFSAAGSILIQKEKTNVVTELQDKVDSLELRISSLDKQEKNMTGKAALIQKQIQEVLASNGVPTAQ